LIKTIKSISHFDEDKYVKEYMSQYGIDNVRGGTYSNIVLDDNCIAVLEKEIRHSKNECMRCGRDTHFIKDCYAKIDIDGKNIDDVCKKHTEISNKKPNVYKAKTKKNYPSHEDEDSNSYSDNDEDLNVKKKFVRKYIKPCDICGMKGHREINCYNS